MQGCNVMPDNKQTNKQMPGRKQEQDIERQEQAQDENMPDVEREVSRREDKPQQEQDDSDRNVDYVDRGGRLDQPETD